MRHGYTQLVNSAIALRGVLLDIDGTLVLSNDAHAHAWVEAFAARGIRVRFEDVRPLIGMGADKIIPGLAPRLSKNEGLGKEIDALRKHIFLSRYAVDLQPAPGARALLERMRADGLRLEIASSAQEEELQTLLKMAGVDDLLEPPQSGSEGKESKPSPDIIAVALERSKLQPQEVVMVGDTPFDILAAAKVGVRTIALRCGGWDDARLRDAIAIYDHPADFLAHYDESPIRRPFVTSTHDGR